MPKYISKISELKLVIKSAYKKEVNGEIIVIPGKRIEFTDGLFETENKEEIEFLAKNPNNGPVFIEIKSKDLQGKKEEFTKTPEEKKAEEEAEKEAKEKKDKELKGKEEGGGIINKILGGGKKKEEPKF